MVHLKNANGAVYHENFPDATRPTSYNNSTAPANPFAYWNQAPEYEYKQKMRENQLKNMQEQNNTLPTLTPEQIPGTFQDLSLTEQMGIMREGWQDPALNKYPSYPSLNVESDEEAAERRLRIAESKAEAEIAAARPELLKAEIERQKAAAEAALLEAQRRLLETKDAEAK